VGELLAIPLNNASASIGAPEASRASMLNTKRCSRD
jgi:hypothetical protein